MLTVATIHRGNCSDIIMAMVASGAGDIRRMVSSTMLACSEERHGRDDGGHDQCGEDGPGQLLHSEGGGRTFGDAQALGRPATRP